MYKLSTSNEFGTTKSVRIRMEILLDNMREQDNNEVKCSCELKFILVLMLSDLTQNRAFSYGHIEPKKDRRSPHLPNPTININQQVSDDPRPYKKLTETTLQIIT